LEVPVLPWGSRYVASHAGIVREGGTSAGALILPEDFEPSRSSARLRVYPNTYEVVQQQLQDLAEYPHGCVEQTMSRFMPDVLIAQALKSATFKDEKLEAELPKMVSRGLQALYGHQNPDGGWGWFRERHSDPFMSAYALWGLGLAKSAGHKVDANVLSRGTNAVVQLLNQEKAPDARAYMAMALAAADAASSAAKKAAQEITRSAKSLRPHGLAFLMTALHSVGLDAGGLRPNLLSLAARSDRGLSWPGSVSTQSRFARFTGIESSGYALRALALAGGDKAALDQAALNLYLALSLSKCSTKEAAAAIYGLAEHIRATGLTRESGRELRLKINGKEVKGDVAPELFRPGENALEANTEDGFVLYALSVEYYSREREIRAGGNTFGVSRHYLQSPLRDRDRPEELDLTKLNKAEQAAVGGDLVVSLHVVASEDARYVILEDPIPSGFEIIDSSWMTERERDQRRWRRFSLYAGRFTHAEAHDDRMAFFFRGLQRGKERTVFYRLRAETPDTYPVMPAQAHEMYDESKRGNSASARLVITD